MENGLLLAVGARGRVETGLVGLLVVGVGAEASVLRRVVHMDSVVALVEHCLLLLRVLVARAWSHIGHHSVLHPLHMVVIELCLHLLLRELLRQQCRGLLCRWLCLVDALGRLRGLGRLMVLVVLSNR